MTLGLCDLSGAEQRLGKGQAALVMLAVEVQHALFSSFLDKTTMPGVILWFSAQVCRDCEWCQSHSVQARKSILIIGILDRVRGGPRQVQNLRDRVPGTVLEIK